MSTTADRKVAAHYASAGNAATIMELEQGMVDRGAELSWLSQYPYEREVRPTLLPRRYCHRPTATYGLLPSHAISAALPCVAGAVRTTNGDRDAWIADRGIDGGRRDGAVREFDVANDRASRLEDETFSPHAARPSPRASGLRQRTDGHAAGAISQASVSTRQASHAQVVSLASTPHALIFCVSLAFGAIAFDDPPSS
jgi:hypothetical protein